MKHISLEQVFSALVGLGGVVGALTTIGMFFYMVLFRPFRNFLRKEISANLIKINETVERTEQQLLAHIANPVAHQTGEYHGVGNAQSETDGTRPQQANENAR